METWEVLAIDKNAVMRIKSENKEIPGVRFLLRGSEPVGGTNDRYLGFNWHDQFVSNARLEKLNVQPMPGDVINIYFNRYGDIIKLEIV